MPAQADKSEVVPADTVVARYFQYLNYQTFDTAYEALTEGLCRRVPYESYVEMQNTGCSYQVDALSRNKIDDENAEVIANVMVADEDGSNPRYIKYRFVLKKEEKKWKIDSYDFCKE